MPSNSQNKFIIAFINKIPKQFILAKFFGEQKKISKINLIKQERISTYCQDDMDNMQALEYFLQEEDSLCLQFFNKTLPFIITTALELPDVIKQVCFYKLRLG